MSTRYWSKARLLTGKSDYVNPESEGGLKAGDIVRLLSGGCLRGEIGVFRRYDSRGRAVVKLETGTWTTRWPDDLLLVERQKGEQHQCLNVISN